MEDLDLEQQEPFPVDRNGRRLGDAADQPDGGRPAGCCERFQLSVSKWMLPEDHREKYLERANCCPPPIFIVLISIAELAVFIYYAVWKPQKQWVTLDEGIWKSPLTYKPEVRQEAWRFISYMFVHAGVQHIFGNLVMQLLVGIPLELVHKGFEVGMVYMAGVLAGHPFFFNCISYFIFVVGSYWSSSICVFPLGTSGSCFFLFVLASFLSEVPLIFSFLFFLLADVSRLPSGSLCSSIFDPLSALVGASGGVYALIGGYFMNAVVNFREMIPVLGVFRILAIVIFVATDFGFAFYRRFLSEDAGLKVSFVAHFGGIVAGMTVGYVFFSAYNQKLLKDPRFWLCIVGYLLFLIFAVVFNVVLSPAP